jgi:hypothetical protein
MLRHHNAGENHNIKAANKPLKKRNVVWLLCVRPSVTNQNFVRFQVPSTASMKMTVFWVIAPCSLVEVYRRFRGTYCLHHQGDECKLLPDYTAQQPRRQPSSNLYFIHEESRLNSGNACCHAFENT